MFKKFFEKFLSKRVIVKAARFMKRKDDEDKRRAKEKAEYYAKKEAVRYGTTDFSKYEVPHFEEPFVEDADIAQIASIIDEEDNPPMVHKLKWRKTKIDKIIANMEKIELGKVEPVKDLDDLFKTLPKADTEQVWDNSVIGAGHKNYCASWVEDDSNGRIFLEVCTSTPNTPNALVLNDELMGWKKGTVHTPVDVPAVSANVREGIFIVTKPSGGATT